MRTHIKRTVAAAGLLLALWACCSLLGCNTIQGAGRDLQTLGSWLEGAGTP